jgi:hypothetical protein
VNLAFFPQPVPLGLATHGCGLFPLHLPKTRQYGGERILIPDGRPKRAPRKPKTYPMPKRRRVARN